MGKKLKFLKLERMKGLPRADFRAPVETEPMEICGPTHPRLGTGFSAQECGDQSREPLPLGSVRETQGSGLEERAGGGSGCFSTDLAHLTPTPVEVPSPFLSHGTSGGFWGASDLSVSLVWKPALGQAAGGWGLADPGPWIGEGRTRLSPVKGPGLRTAPHPSRLFLLPPLSLPPFCAFVSFPPPSLGPAPARPYSRLSPPPPFLGLAFPGGARSLQVESAQREPWGGVRGGPGPRALGREAALQKGPPRAARLPGEAERPRGRRGGRPARRELGAAAAPSGGWGDAEPR